MSCVRMAGGRIFSGEGLVSPCGQAGSLALPCDEFALIRVICLVCVFGAWNRVGRSCSWGMHRRADIALGTLFASTLPYVMHQSKPICVVSVSPTLTPSTVLCPMCLPPSFCKSHTCCPSSLTYISVCRLCACSQKKMSLLLILCKR